MRTSLLPMPVKSVASVVPVLSVLLVFLLISCNAQDDRSDTQNNRSYTSMKTPVAVPFNTGFEQAGNTWNSISSASNGKIYYSFSTTDIDQGAQFFVYDPETDEIEMLADLTEVTDGTEIPMIPQGKSHANFYERDGKLYISTHVGVHGSVLDGEVALTREGYEPYPGGHFLSYDLSSGEYERLAMAPDNEGILSMTMDTERGHLYGITWPLGYFIHYDIDAGEFHDLGLVSGRGEAGTPGEDFRVLGRSLFVDAQDGSVYFSTADGDIFSYSPYTNALEMVQGVDLRRDYFGEHDPTRPGSMAYGWRQIVWHPDEEVAYGVHGKSGYLFRFDPREPSLELVERITSVPSRKSGMFDQYYYGYLGFDLGPDGETLYYLTGGPIYIDGQRVSGDNAEELGLHSREIENTHLVTWHIPTGTYTDHGPIKTSDGSRITDAQSIAFGTDGTVYTLGRFERGGDRVMDLLAISNPFGE